MTVVVAAAFDGVPTVISDLLISGNEDPNKVIVLPTIGDVTNAFPLGSGFVPVGLSQKAVIIGPNVVLGWSGTMLYARAIVEDVRKRIAIQIHDADSLRELLRELIQEYGAEEEVGFVGYIKEPKGFRSFWANAIAHTVPGLGKVSFTGSGSDDFRQLLQSGMDFTFRRGAPTLRGEAISKALGLTGALLNLELVDPTFLSKYYGGAYEITQFNGTTFEKTSDVTSVFFIAGVDEDGQGVKLKLNKIMKNVYVKDWLLLSVLSPSNSTPNSCSPEMFAISPFGFSGQVPIFPSLESINWNSALVAIYVIHPLKGIFCSMSYAKTPDSAPIQFRNAADGIEFKFDDAFIERLKIELTMR